MARKILRAIPLIASALELCLFSQEIKAQVIDLTGCHYLPGSETRTGNIYPGGHWDLESKLGPRNGRRTEYAFAHSFKKYIDNVILFLLPFS